MVIIEINKEDREKVLEILLTNGKFRALGDNKFDIMEHEEEVLKRIDDKGIKLISKTPPKNETL